MTPSLLAGKAAKPSDQQKQSIIVFRPSRGEQHALGSHDVKEKHGQLLRTWAMERRPPPRECICLASSKVIGDKSSSAK